MRQRQILSFTPSSSSSTKTKSNKNADDTPYHTYPLQLGNLFDTPWNADPSCTSNHPTKNKNKLRTSLLEYHISCGWIIHHAKNNNISHEEKNKKRRTKLSNILLRRVLLESAARGDVRGISFLAEKGLCNLQDDAKELCTVAGAAGRIEALRWLREERNCAWDVSEVYREALENSELGVMSYVEMNSGTHEIQMHYGIGLPW